MPVTPFHYPVAYLISKLNLRLSLPGLIVGALMPDIEIPFIALLSGFQPTNRLVLHSLLGAATIGTILSLTVTVLIYPKLTSAIFPISKSKVQEKCQFSGTLALSCLLGGLSHVFLDVTNHTYNPVFWPFLGIYETPSPIVPLLGGQLAASLLVTALMVVLFVGLFIGKREHFWERLLIE